MTKEEQENLRKEIRDVFKNKNNLEEKTFIAIENFINKRDKDVPVISASKEVALICIEKQLELLRYLGSKDPKKLYNELVEQKRLLNNNKTL